MSDQPVDPAHVASPMTMLDAALQLAGRGWPVFPIHTVTFDGSASGPICSCSKGRGCGKNAGKHPRIKGGFKGASTDPAQIAAWWAKWLNANIGLATGSVCVLDVDGEAGMAELKALVAAHEPLPETYTVQTGGGLHLYFQAVNGARSSAKGNLHVRAAGGYVVAPPSLHRSGKRYAVIRDVAVAQAPSWLADWILAGAGAIPGRPDKTRQSGDSRRPVGDSFSGLGERPAWVSGAAVLASTALVSHIPAWSAHEEARLRSALAAIPPSIDGRTWASFGRALHDLQWVVDGADRGLELWDSWSRVSQGRGDGLGEYRGRQDLEKRWISYGNGTGNGPTVTVATIYHTAQEYGWTGAFSVEAPPKNGHVINGEEFFGKAVVAPNPLSPLIDLNNRYSVVGNMGGKALVMQWVPSTADSRWTTPAFQSFNSFREFYSNQYVVAGREEKPKPLGDSWLKWPGRKTYERLDLVPGGELVLPGNVLNLWRGFSVTPAAGCWDRMKQHITNVLACNNSVAAAYIFNWIAWAVQHPDQRAEVALVLRGGKGSGKGTFGNAMCEIFGSHGQHIYSPKHLVGSFNAHLRNCLLLFADEAFWAGDRQGESTLKGLITEPTIQIEQKGIDTVAWKNRLHVIMAANAEWVVPAGKGERRYAVFDVSDAHASDFEYFKGLTEELRNGGLAAMLWDLQHLELGGWHPRNIPSTSALEDQKKLSLTGPYAWWHDTLQDGFISKEAIVSHKAREPNGLVLWSSQLLEIARELCDPRITKEGLGRMMRKVGNVGGHDRDGNYWTVPALAVARSNWEQMFGKWSWECQRTNWNE